jgi:hypothetical protein
VYPSSSGSYPIDSSGLGGPTISYATAGIALRISGALKPHHHDKVGIASVGFYSCTLATGCNLDGQIIRFEFFWVKFIFSPILSGRFWGQPNFYRMEIEVIFP